MNEIQCICRICNSNACSEISEGESQMWLCFGCGFTANNQNIEPEVLPELYKDLKKTDSDGYNWYPITVNLPQKGMVFIDGKNILDWKWSAVKASKINYKEISKFPKGQTHKMDMSKKKEFGERDFIEALDFIKYFDK